ncbi:MAG: M23 family metallopeptidase [Candidatus Competibacteraceae bacterium]|nr:M23 family metallopeptidase [Candidatus Competibacteraceae bacterium]
MSKTTDLRPVFKHVLLSIAMLVSLGLVSCGGGNGEYRLSVINAEAQFTPILMRVLSSLIAVQGSDERFHLVYELELKNPLSGNAVLEQIKVYDPDTDQVLATLDSTAIATRFQIGGINRTGLTTLLGPAQFGVLYLHLQFDTRESVPLTLAHQVTAAIDLDNLPPGSEISAGGMAAVRFEPVTVLGAPFKGENFIAADGCCESIRHIRALLPINGGLWLAQRFAIDWEQLDEQNRVFVGDPQDPRSYHIYGKDLLAVADATVVVAVDEFADQVPGAIPTGVAVSEADGNHIILDLGNGGYVLYAHLEPGSVAVAVGETVQKGQVIGRVGNSGNTSEPHLHLHVMDAPSALVADGLPYVFENYEITGINLAGTADFDNAAATGEPATITTVDPPTSHRNQLPMDLTVVRWPE